MDHIQKDITYTFGEVYQDKNNDHQLKILEKIEILRSAKALQDPQNHAAKTEKPNQTVKIIPNG